MRHIRRAYVVLEESEQRLNLALSGAEGAAWEITVSSSGGRLRIMSPGFLAAVLDHIAESDSLLLEFAGNLRLNPEAVGEARRLLAGPEPDGFA